MKLDIEGVMMIVISKYAAQVGCLIESESESFYSVLLQTQETSAKTISGRCRRGHLEKSIHECMYVK